MSYTLFRMTTLYFAFLGACFGSFSSVLIYRLHNDEPNVLLGRSHCCHTGKKLRWWELIPVFSWLFLRGKSAHSGKKIPVLYFLLEVVYAAVFGVFAWKYLPDFGFENVLLFLPLLTAVFFSLVLFFYDAQFMEVDRRISWPAIGLAVLMAIFQEKSADFFLGGAIGFVFYWLQYTISKGKWVGGGDQELALFMGLLLGWKDMLLALFLAYIIGTVFSCGLLAVRKNMNMQSAVPMGAFLMPALLLFLYDSEWWWNLFELVFGF